MVNPTRWARLRLLGHLCSSSFLPPLSFSSTVYQYPLLHDPVRHWLSCSPMTVKSALEDVIDLNDLAHLLS